tara:strand:+ start:8373 stop:9809 length:1437 start_codon:yes stop_codon:yes gene_type:complete
MPKRDEKLVIGQRVKVFRKSLGLTQAQMAAELDISPSYITLIEANQRPVSAKLLLRLAEVFDVKISELAPSTNVQLASDFASILKDPLLEAEGITPAEIESVLESAPKIAAALVHLHEKHSQLLLRDQADDNPLTDRDKVDLLAQSSRPVEKVRAWFYEIHNYIDPLDRAAEQMADALDFNRSKPNLRFSERLATHKIRIRIMPSHVMGPYLRRYQPHSHELLLSELLEQPSRRFQMAVLLAKLEYDDLVEDVLLQSGLQGEDTLALARVSLYNYFAAALMMPYQAFLAACESERYDVELISHRFGASYEQAAHRMSTLQRPEARGIPFFFVRIDRAGNVSKRFSAGRFPFSKFGGTCPLWNIHSAFESPDQVHTQVIRMPEGASYFSIARTVTRSGGTHGKPAPKFAIGLGCDIAYAPRLIYSDNINMERVEPTDIGLNCYLCERSNCSSRAHAPVNRRLAINERERSLAIFQFEGE